MLYGNVLLEQLSVLVLVVLVAILRLRRPWAADDITLSTCACVRACVHAWAQAFSVRLAVDF